MDKNKCPKSQNENTFKNEKTWKNSKKRETIKKLASHQKKFFKNL